ncbi:hypothetical protein [Actinophytocola sp.]|uniref:hypothetical protein n=1 Tax=Actinophytocola sp. TaxID=1872138 RepID=UPI003D6B9707
MTRRAAAAVAGLVLAVVGSVSCGVSTQDEPLPIEDTSIHQTPATPSVETGPATAPSPPDDSPQSSTQSSTVTPPAVPTTTPEP